MGEKRSVSTMVGERSMLLFAVSVSLLLLVSACSKDSKIDEVDGVERSGIKATVIATKYEYGEGVKAAMGIPSGAKVYRTKDREAIGEPVLVASDAALVDEPVDGEELRVIRVNYSLRNIEGSEVANMVAFFKPFADRAHVVKTLLQDRYESIYRWGEIPGHSPVTVTTTDLNSGQKVLETGNLEFIEESQGLFQGIERHFKNGKQVCILHFIRHIGTGLLVDEMIVEGTLPMDYHTYEFVLTGWPSGRSPGF